MAQTGVPFGEVAHVRDFLGIEKPVDRPAGEHPKRPVLGFACPRSEVSGRRLWGWVSERFSSRDEFFKRFFVWNWCPLVFLEAGGRNRTPDKLDVASRRLLESACDGALREVVEVLRPRMVIGVGGFARKRAEKALAGCDIPIHQILHPSPASPAANRGWAPQIERQLKEIGLSMCGCSSA
jgi:single-strand selective monofunctional uracil DNA glycosylase